MDLNKLQKSLDVLQSALDARDVDGAVIILRSIQYDVVSAQQSEQGAGEPCGHRYVYPSTGYCRDCGEVVDR